MKKTIIIVILVIACFFLGFLFGRGRTEKEAIKVGVLADLSGDYTSFLRGIIRGVEIATQDMVGETGREIKLFVEDQKSCDAKETITAMNKLVFVDKVDFIVGGSCSNTTIAAAPIANESKTIMISPSSSAPSVTQAGEYIFRTYPSDEMKAEAAGKIAYELGKRKMALVIGLDNEATLEAALMAKDTFLSLGGEITIEEEIDGKTRDFKTLLTKIKQTFPDVLLLSITNPNQIGLVIKQARELGIDIQIIHTLEAPENKEVIEIAGQFAEGLIYTKQADPPSSERFEELKRKYKEKYKEEDIPLFLTEAYDALVLGVKAVIESNGGDVRGKLFEVSKTYQGISGNVEFDENGDVVKTASLRTIKDGQFVPYQ